MKIKHIILFVFFFSISICRAQKPEVPVINYLTVDPETNYIDIYWQKSPSPGIKYYQVNLWYLSIYSIKIDSTLADSTHFTIKKDVHPENKAESIIILAVDSAGTPSALTNFHSSIHLDAFYDTCKYTANLSWNAYYGWTAVESYEVWLSKDGSPYSLLQTIPGTTLAFVHQHAVDTAEYCYYVAAVRKDGIRSRSNKSCMQAVTNITNLNVILTSIRPSADQSLWNFAFHTDLPVNYLSYLVQRSANPYDNFDSLLTVQAGHDQISFNDALQANNELYYKVSAIKPGCKEIYGEPAVMKPLTATSGKTGTTGYSVAWNYYPGSQYNLNGFTVYAEIPQSIKKVLTKTMNSSYDIVTEPELADFAAAGQICFSVEADLQYNSDTSGISLISNSVCFLIETEISIADAFTPNGDGKNDVITPRLNRAPSDFIFIVYDRWGRKTFESHSYTEGWDGTTSGGKATEGVYTYVIKGKGFNGKNFEKVGYFSLIYP